MTDPSSAELVKIVGPMVHEGLVGRGWQKVRIRRVYISNVGTDVIGIVHLFYTLGRAATWVAVNPHIAVRHQLLERKLAEIMGERFRPYDPGTIPKPLGYLMPQRKYMEWAFKPGTEVRSKADEMLDAIDEYGGRFIRRHATLADIVKGMESPEFSFDLLHWFRLPVAYLLLGDKTRAKQLIDDYLQKMEPYGFQLPDQFRKFVRNLTPYLR